LVHRPYTTKYHVSPTLISSVKSNLPTSLKTIEPYRLKALIEEDLRFHPDSMVADISKRLPDVDIEELKKTIRKMAIDRLLITNGGRKFRTYRLP
jgi:ATP-dependent DNA helicase RecG